MAFKIGDFVTLKNNTENKGFPELFGKVGEVIGHQLSVGRCQQQFIRVQWKEKTKPHYIDLKAARFKEIKKTS